MRHLVYNPCYCSVTQGHEKSCLWIGLSISNLEELEFIGKSWEALLKLISCLVSFNLCGEYFFLKGCAKWNLSYSSVILLCCQWIHFGVCLPCIFLLVSHSCQVQHQQCKPVCKQMAVNSSCGSLCTAANPRHTGKQVRWEGYASRLLIKHRLPHWHSFLLSCLTG